MTVSRSASGLAAFLLGLFANLAQIAALRLFLGTFAGTELHLGLFLGIWLGGLAFGAAWAGFQQFHLSRLIAWAAISPALSLALLVGILQHLPANQGLLIPMFHSFLLMAGLLLPFAIPLGALLPTLIQSPRRPFQTLASPYAIESGGSFVGGILLSIILGGMASPLSVFLILPLPALTAFFACSGFNRKAAIPLLIWPLIAMAALPRVEPWLEAHFWLRLQPGTHLQLSRETPYQHVAIGEYEGQKSLLSNGIFVDSWPDAVRAEDRIHTFLTAIASPESLLIVGTPVPDLLSELAKYPALRTTIIDLDQDFQTLMMKEYGDISSRSFCQIAIDPRQFFRLATATWDGILLLPSDPSSLADNRLFTAEAFTQMAQRLNRGGVLGFSLSGTENYLGEELQETLLSTWRTLRSAFPETFALPGDSIQFWASPTPGALATTPALLAERFSRRGIPTISFSAPAFANRLLPFRVQELQHWLQREAEAPVNTDAHPKAFQRQLQLWDIYSNSRLTPLLKELANWNIERSLEAVFVVFSILATLFLMIRPRSAPTAILSLSAGISGGASLLAELGFIYLFQNRDGAMIQRTALFFGTYMAGLACGSISGARIPGSLFRLKIFQTLLLAGAAVLTRFPEWHGWIPISLCIFLTAFLAGRELPLIDRRLQQECAIEGPRSAGLLFWADNIGGMGTAILAGPWLFPILGIEGAFILTTAVLAGNAILLLLIPKKSD